MRGTPYIQTFNPSWTNNHNALLMKIAGASVPGKQCPGTHALRSSWAALYINPNGTALTLPSKPGNKPS
jgi:hypothetical protein